MYLEQEIQQVAGRRGLVRRVAAKPVANASVDAALAAGDHLENALSVESPLKKKSVRFMLGFQSQRQPTLRPAGAARALAVRAAVEWEPSKSISSLC